MHFLFCFFKTSVILVSMFATIKMEIVTLTLYNTKKSINTLLGGIGHLTCATLEMQSVSKFDVEVEHINYGFRSICVILHETVIQYLLCLWQSGIMGSFSFSSRKRIAIQLNDG